jgi:hypothetical protein
MQDKIEMRQTTLSVVMFGIGLAFAITGRAPGWQPFAAACMLAVLTLIIALSKWRASSRWSGLLTLAVLMLSILWDLDKPLGMVLAVGLVALRALSMGASTGAKTDVQAVNGEQEII